MAETHSSNTTATKLAGGKVLVTGCGSELYDPASDTWTSAGSSPGCYAALTLLPSGRVLASGGYTGMFAVGKVALYDPASSAWSPLGGLAHLRYGHTATALPSAKVMMVGGSESEVYDPTSIVWVSTGPMLSDGAFPVATQLPSGRVLVAGGWSSESGQPAPVARAEIYDPKTNMWLQAASMTVPRWPYSALLLPSGKVPVTGNYWEPKLTCELYDETTDQWLPAGTNCRLSSSLLLHSGKVLSLGVGVYDPQADTLKPHAPIPAGLGQYFRSLLLHSGKVLVIGGDPAVMYFYDPEADTWSFAGALPPDAGGTAAVLGSGKVLFAGGAPAHGTVFDPDSRTWTVTGPMIEPWRYNHTLSVLPWGEVLAAGGQGNAVPLQSAELYDPLTNTWRRTGSMIGYSVYGNAIVLRTGKVLVIDAPQAEICNVESPFSSSTYLPAIRR
jgi:hypothetical protein